MIILEIKTKQPLDLHIKKFRRIINKSNILNKFRSKMFYQKPNFKKKIRKAAADIKRNYNKLKYKKLIM